MCVMSPERRLAVPSSAINPLYVRDGFEYVLLYTVFHKKHPLRLFVIYLLNCGQFL